MSGQKRLHDKTRKHILEADPDTLLAIEGLLPLTLKGKHVESPGFEIKPEMDPYRFGKPIYRFALYDAADEYTKMVKKIAKVWHRDPAKTLKLMLTKIQRVQERQMGNVDQSKIYDDEGDETVEQDEGDNVDEGDSGCGSAV
ncbi:hypothetical protein K491DRAFT_718156 [Lophiostoma macrostomum CBS 122681]|uniref:Uncharacterized protein n=1 Tax=Lophiostoma macrostomum CBS 122681 TaxID=1314788 RepID=A0A6A6SZX6_9PLEO|nr:hypothetical protein K491DRAFT_718156 [Lophiostoma macrostomum CBS 122681]